MDWKEMLGQLMEDPSLPEGEDVTPEEPSAPAKKDRLRVIVDKKGRKGKVATIVEGFTVTNQEVAETAAVLKKKLGTGGSARGGEILIQGDCAAKLRQLLAEMGYRVS